MSWTTSVREAVSGGGLRFRIFRGSAWTLIGYAASQALRLGSNLILTRILFPEAFGVMALVTAFLVGLVMLSDVGISPSIMQSKRGDDRSFLDTAWTLQVVRGVLLALILLVLAGPVADLYEAPILSDLLAVASISLVLNGFNPTAMDTANRHLALGRVTMIELASQFLGTVTMIVLALVTGSIWSLVVGMIGTDAARLVLARRLLPGGSANRFHWERAAAHELIHFGKWIFLSTACGFLIAQGDRLILGVYVALGQLGIYNIGYFLASFPVLLGGAVAGRILIPVYRLKPPAESRENFDKIRRMRFALSGLLLSLLLCMALVGLPLVELLYDPRYSMAGAVLVIVACVNVPLVVGMTYDQSALAAGDSRRFAFLTVARAAAMLAGMSIGAENGGLVGALVGQGAAFLVTYPIIIWIARVHGAWDWLHDLVCAVCSVAIAALAIWLHRAAILELLSAGF